MDRITDRFEFDRHIEAVRENAAGLPATRGHLIDRLGLLIEDALAELAGEKFATPRSMGDLSSADGIAHLFADYPAAIPPGGKHPRPFLTVEEAAAARYLVALYRARDSLNDGFGLTEDELAEIEATGRELLTWRLHGPALQHEKRTRAEKVGQQKGGSAKAKNQKAELEDRDKKIIRRAKTMVGHYSQTEILDVLVREFSKRYKIGRPRISQIVSSVFPKKQTRAKSSE